MIRCHYQVLESTNDWAKKHIDQWDKNAVTLITADQQTAGRGRFGRQWSSPAGKNLYGSFVFFLEEEQLDITRLVRLLAESTVAVLQALGFSPVIKWPNDLLIDSKKIVGILCETVAATPPLVGVILGIGLNVNMSEEELGLIDQPATSLKVLSGHLWEVEKITNALAYRFEQDVKPLMVPRS
jgi:BirA family biotin operon repressor/biotin-[acetyl-CoA-carboxylase] ligase